LDGGTGAKGGGGRRKSLAEEFVDKAYARGPLSRQVLATRLEATECKEYQVGSTLLSVRVAALSQRGYYPEALDKPNQDAHRIWPNFMGDASKHLFGVFDGHGSTGDKCSIYARDKIMTQLQRSLKIYDASTKEGYDEAASHAFLKVNTDLKHEPSINDRMSGTTAITVFIDGLTCHVSNVGDSRAILASRKRGVDGPLTVTPLSEDQTPFRADERERVKTYGARVMTMDQIEGKERIHENWGLNLGEELDNNGDPPRVWSPHGHFPGTAFTRSLGDQLAESLGVTAEPESITRTLKRTDKFIVVASDGVWEFITSSTVAGMVEAYPEPLEACRAVCAEAYRLWTQFEVRTDDITMINIHLDWAPDPAEVAAEKRRISMIESGVSGFHLHDARPVRRGMSHQKRQAVLGRKSSTSTASAETFDIEQHRVAKTAEEEAGIRAAVKANRLFAGLNAEQLRDVVSVVQPAEAAAGEAIIEQGGEGDFYYILSAGEADVFVRQTGHVLEGDGAHVFSYSALAGAAGAQPSFGELALMYGRPRAATVRARTACRLWRLGRLPFRAVLLKSAHRDAAVVLKTVKTLACLNGSQRQRLAEVLTEVAYADGAQIVKQGQVGDTFHLVKSGGAVCRLEKGGGEASDVLELKPNDFLGEAGLCGGGAQHAVTVVARGATVCLEVARKRFEEVLGPLDTIAALVEQRSPRPDEGGGGGEGEAPMTPRQEEGSGSGSGGGGGESGKAVFSPVQRRSSVICPPTSVEEQRREELAKALLAPGGAAGGSSDDGRRVRRDRIVLLGGGFDADCGRLTLCRHASKPDLLFMLKSVKKAAVVAAAAEAEVLHEKDLLLRYVATATDRPQAVAAEVLTATVRLADLLPPPPPPPGPDISTPWTEPSCHPCWAPSVTPPLCTRCSCAPGCALSRPRSSSGATPTGSSPPRRPSSTPPRWRWR
jgi:serine/threonine protein phosphatase PrpC/CRP-like cAMP-binding protein